MREDQRKDSLRVPDLTVFRLEIFGQQAVNLQQSFAGEVNVAIFNLQVTCRLLIAEGVCEFVEDVDPELSLKRVAGNVAFLQLNDDFSNQCLMSRWSQSSIDRKFASLDRRLVILDLVKVLIVDTLKMPERRHTGGNQILSSEKIIAIHEMVGIERPDQFVAT